MLTQILIRDYATISSLHLDLSHGITMITGETGSGKSIFIEAIEIGLGGRLGQNSVRAGKEKADISLCFDVTRFPKVIELLQSLDLYTDNAECIIRRVITQDGRSRCFINGFPTTLQISKDLGELLFHLHSQHEQQVLLRSEKQREMLDRYGDHLALVNEVKAHADKWKAIQDEIVHLTATLQLSDNRRDYLLYQLEELDNLKLGSGEWEALETEHHKLTHVDEVLRQLQKVMQLIDNDSSNNLITMLNEIRKTLETMLNVESKTATWLSNVESAAIQINDLSSELQLYLGNTETDPEKLQHIEQRISQIFTIARKHKIAPADLTALQTNLQSELAQIDSAAENIVKLKQQQNEIEHAYKTFAQELHEKRKAAALKLEKEITKTIRSLSLPHGEFKILFEVIANDVPSIHGSEKVIFLIKTNPDQPCLPLAKVISGGELSRLSLAVHLALAHRTNIPTLIFDEIDTGLSGATAEKIGKLLRKLGDTYQVYCVTHQAQVAAYGHHHLLVEKKFVDNCTFTQLRLLNAKEKTREIARLLGGEKITEKTLEHAREVLQGV